MTLLLKLNDGSFKDLPVGFPSELINDSFNGSASEGYMTFESWDDVSQYKATLSPIQIVQYEVPTKVTNAQFRCALIESGIYPEQIDVIINSLSDAKAKARAKQWWDYANEIERSSVLVNTLAPVFSLTPTDVDNMFIYASKQNS